MKRAGNEYEIDRDQSRKRAVVEGQRDNFEY